VKELLFFLLILLCPLSMLFMMRGMHGGAHGRSHDAGHAEVSGHGAQGADADREVEALRGEQGVLEGRIVELEQRLSELDEARASKSGPVLKRA